MRIGEGVDRKLLHRNQVLATSSECCCDPCNCLKRFYAQGREMEVTLPVLSQAAVSSICLDSRLGGTNACIDFTKTYIIPMGDPNASLCCSFGELNLFPMVCLGTLGAGAANNIQLYVTVYVIDPVTAFIGISLYMKDNGAGQGKTVAWTIRGQDAYDAMNVYCFEGGSDITVPFEGNYLYNGLIPSLDCTNHRGSLTGLTGVCSTSGSALLRFI